MHRLRFVLIPGFAFIQNVIKLILFDLILASTGHIDTTLTLKVKYAIEIIYI